jgi:aspartyl-tRNA(Asn)/glutamyl-tRNA(Gln) amidotransferase subunit C
MNKTNFLSKDDVLRVAQLAKLDLSESEVEKFQNQLSEILTYMKELNDVDVSDVDPTARVGNIENIFREDKVEDSLGATDALSQSNSVKDQLFKVDAIFD